MTRLLFVPGSLRKASSSRALMTALIERLDGAFEAVIAETRTLPHYDADLEPDEAVTTFKRQIAEADGVVFATPEYNYSVPGTLKNAIDWASRPAMESVFAGKPCFVITVSGGALGGVRAQAHLKYVLNGMLAQVFTCPEIVVPRANAKVEDGRFADESVLAFAEKHLMAFLAELAARQRKAA